MASYYWRRRHRRASIFNNGVVAPGALKRSKSKRIEIKRKRRCVRTRQAWLTRGALSAYVVVKAMAFKAGRMLARCRQCAGIAQLSRPYRVHQTGVPAIALGIGSVAATRRHRSVLWPCIKQKARHNIVKSCAKLLCACYASITRGLAIEVKMKQATSW